MTQKLVLAKAGRLLRRSTVVESRFRSGDEWTLGDSPIGSSKVCTVTIAVASQPCGPLEVREVAIEG